MERNINVWLFLARPLLGTWPATQAHTLTGNRTGNALLCSPVLSPLSHKSQGLTLIILTTVPGAMIPLSQVSKLRPTQSKWLVPGHLASQWGSCSLSLVPLMTTCRSILRISEMWEALILQRRCAWGTQMSRTGCIIHTHRALTFGLWPVAFVTGLGISQNDANVI